jgi:hypothetical protein
MTRVWSEGFEMGDLVGYTLPTATLPTISTTRRSGSYAVHIHGGNYTNCKLQKSITAGSEFYFRVAVYINNFAYTANHNIYFMNGSNTVGSIQFNNSNYIYISINGLTDTGSTLLLVNTWYLIEVHIKVDNTTGVLEVKLEGIPEVDVSGDTQGSYSTIDSIVFLDSSDDQIWIDDIALNDTAGAADNSWCGDGKIIKLTPDDDVTTELTQYPALTDHHADVDDYPADGDTTYVQGTVVDEEDLYELSASGLVAADVDTINRVWVESRSKDTVASGGEVALFIVSNAVEDTGADVILTTTYTTKVLSEEFLQNPDGPAAWSVAALDALQAGVRTRA